MGMWKLEWLTIALPVAAVVVFDYARHDVFPDLLHQWPGSLSLMGLVVAGGAALSWAVYALFARREQHLLRTTEELSIVSAAALAAAQNEGLPAVADAVLRRVTELLGLPGGVILYVSADTGELGIQSCLGCDSENAVEMGRQAWTQRPSQPPDPSVWPFSKPSSVGDASPHRDGERWQRVSVVALRSGHRLVGLMLLPAPKNAPLVADFRLLGVLGHQIGAMLENARLYERAQSLAVLEERDRIAREMHDSLAQVLGFLKMKASLAGQRLRGGESDRAAQEVDEMAALAEEAYVDVREAILGLRDSIIPGIGLMGTLAEYLRKFSRQSGVCIRLEHPDGMNPRLSPMVEVQLVRVVQEALTNVRKHARARNATLRFKADDGWVDVTIQDDGKGFEVSGMDGSDGRHFGIEMMRERVGSVGGRFAIESAPHRGTTVGFRLPLNGNAKEAYL